VDNNRALRLWHGSSWLVPILSRASSQPQLVPTDVRAGSGVSLIGVAPTRGCPVT